MQWNVKRVMTWTPVLVGGEHSPVAALVKPHPTLSSVHMLNINPPMHNPSGHLPHTFNIAHLQGLKILKYEINPNPNPNPNSNPNPNPTLRVLSQEQLASVARTGLKAKPDTGPSCPDRIYEQTREWRYITTPHHTTPHHTTIHNMMLI